MRHDCSCGHMEYYHWEGKACLLCNCEQFNVPEPMPVDPGPRRPHMPLYAILFLFLVPSGVRAQAVVVCGANDGTIEWRECMSIRPEASEDSLFPEQSSGSVRVETANPASRGVGLGTHHRTADKAWWAANLLSWGLTAADVENTQYCFHAMATCYETNPIFGSRHPSRLRMYAITAPLAGFTSWLSYKWKREDDQDRAILGRTAAVRWYVAPFINAGAHSFGLGFTLVNTGR
jgi:hypothetical protein